MRSFPETDIDPKNRGSCTHHVGLDICYDEYNDHDSLQSIMLCLLRVSRPAIILR